MYSLKNYAHKEVLENLIENKLEVLKSMKLSLHQTNNFQMHYFSNLVGTVLPLFFNCEDREKIYDFFSF